MPRDPDIGTDQECFVCDGSGVIAAHEAKAAPAVPDVDSLAQFIRQIDGCHTMGTAALAERICEWLNDRKATAQAAPAVPQGEPVGDLVRLCPDIECARKKKCTRITNISCMSCAKENYQ